MYEKHFELNENVVMERQIPYWLQEKWQEFANAIAELFSIPAALIMKLDEKEIEVYLSSENAENPIEPGVHIELSGSYCEAVIKNQQELEIPDATQDPIWKNTPSLEMGLLNYLGYPLNYPDGVPFGSLCVLDKKKREHTETEKTILRIFREMIEQDIALVFYYNDKQAELVNTIRRQQNLLYQQEKLKPEDLETPVLSQEQKAQVSACYFKELSSEVNTSLEAILSLSRVIQKQHVSPEDILTYARGIERKSSRLLERLSSIEKAVCKELSTGDNED